MLWYILYNPNCTEYDECLIGLYIFFATMFPIAALAMYITSLCLRIGFLMKRERSIRTIFDGL